MIRNKREMFLACAPTNNWYKLLRCAARLRHHRRMRERRYPDKGVSRATSVAQSVAHLMCRSRTNNHLTGRLRCQDTAYKRPDLSQEVRYQGRSCCVLR